ncbi:MAG: transcriptional regulator NrdR [Candidatus Marinimicrobia bacterium]|nr:transcriptional regulator NrdR [Candidatus Neomarinimicrobiota bacterium]
MKCPYCGSSDNKVIDSRSAQKDKAIRRRRECNACNRRFTTYEHVMGFPLKVIKSDDTRENFDRSKLERSIQIACNKRPIPAAKIEHLVLQIENDIENYGKSEVEAKRIGELVMKGLRQLDEVAYIRYASVYKKFKDLNEFRNQINKFDNN